MQIFLKYNTTSLLKALTLFLFFISGLTAYAQYTPRQITVACENYYVYPLRTAQYEGDIPPCGYTLPDGKYISYSTYGFKFKKKGVRKLIEKDTDNIRVIFEIENNAPVRIARFYKCNLKKTANKKKLSKWEITGAYKGGLKEGEWLAKYKGKIYIKHYKNGLMHGLCIDFKPNGKPFNTYYSEGRKVGYFYFYDEYNHLTSGHYYDTLEIRDSVLNYYRNGKLHTVSDKILNPVQKLKNGIWWKILSSNSHFARNYKVNFSNYKEYSDSGVLIEEMQFKYPENYYFDSALLRGRKVIIKQIDCPEGKKNDTCYEVLKISDDNPEEKEREYYCNQKLYKTIYDAYHASKILVPDTVTQTIIAPDTTINPWNFQVTEKLTGKTYIYTTRYLPAIDYYYTEKYDKEKGLSIAPGSGNYYDLHFSKYWRGYPFYDSTPNERYCIPTLIDSIKKFARFIDTTTDIKTNIKLISEINIAPKEKIKDPLSLDHECLLDITIHYPIQYYDNDILVSDYEFNSFNLTRLDFSSNYSQYNPEIILSKNKPFTGPAFITNQKRNTYTTKKNILIFSGNFVNKNWVYDAIKGAYDKGLRTGLWHFINLPGSIKYKSDFKKYFLSHKKSEYYATVNYENGRKNGICTTYYTYSPKIWEENYSSYKEKPLKYLSSVKNFTNDTLNGAITYYHPTGKPKCIGTYKMGMLEGEVTKYNYKNELVYKAQFKNDELNGEVITFDDFSLQPRIKGNFLNGELHGLLEMFALKKWLEVKADTDYMLYKKLFYDNGMLQEEITLDAKARYKLRSYILLSDNFLSYCPGINKKADKGYYSPNEISRKNSDSLNNFGFNGLYKYYYNTGQLYCEGRIKYMKPSGEWSFYDILGTLINKMIFKDSILHFSGNAKPDTIIGSLTGYYGNGKIRCRAYVKSLDVSYDCNTHADKSAFELIVKDNYDYYGKDSCKSGNGLVKQYNENGQLMVVGKMENYSKTGIWKFYDPEGRLNQMGAYEHNIKEGPWFEGDLEGMNYEGAACFDKSNEDSMKAFQRKQKDLEIKKTIYKKGEMMAVKYFYINMNKD